MAGSLALKMIRVRSTVGDSPSMTFVDCSRAAAVAQYVEAHGGRPEDVAVVHDTDALALLSCAIEDSGLSIAEFARVVVGRDERTVRRWLAREVGIPDSVHQWLDRLADVDVRDGDVHLTLRRQLSKAFTPPD